MTQFPKLLEWSCTYAKLQISIFAPDLLYLCSFTILFLLLIKLSSLLTSFSPFLGFIWLFYGVFLNEDIVHKAFFFSSKLCSVQFSHSVMSNSLWPHGLQHTRLPHPSPIPRAYSNSYLLNQWCHPTTSCSIIPFSSCLKSLPTSGSFPVRQFFTSGGQSHICDYNFVIFQNF